MSKNKLLILIIPLFLIVLTGCKNPMSFFDSLRPNLNPNVDDLFVTTEEEFEENPDSVVDYLQPIIVGIGGVNQDSEPKNENSVIDMLQPYYFGGQQHKSIMDKYIAYKYENSFKFKKYESKDEISNLEPYNLESGKDYETQMNDFNLLILNRDTYNENNEGWKLKKIDEKQSLWELFYSESMEKFDNNKVFNIEIEPNPGMEFVPELEKGGTFILVYPADDSVDEKKENITTEEEPAVSKDEPVGNATVKVVSKGCGDVHKSGIYYWSLCVWKLTYSDGSPLKCGQGDLREPLSEMSGSDGASHKALFEIIEKRFTGNIYNYIGIQGLGPVINPKSNSQYMCRGDELKYTLWKITEAETVQVGISKTNPNYFSYTGNGDLISVTGIQ